MKIINAIWFTEMGSPNPIGIVMGTGEAGERKAYIGTGAGFDEGIDAENIARRGAKLSAVTAASLIEFLK